MTNTEEEELNSLQDLTIDWFGFSPSEQEWMLIFSNGKKLVFSSGEDPYYQLTSDSIN